MNSIIAPVLTEKSATNFDKGVYVFAVAKTATKNSIADELKHLYGVDVLSVRIVNLPAKKVSFKRKPGIRTARRRAYVQINPKQKIAGFEIQKETKDEEKVAEEAK
jgi:large subunit ribosomal protein L23